MYKLIRTTLPYVVLLVSDTIEVNDTYELSVIQDGVFTSRASKTSAPDHHHHHPAEVPRENNRPRSQRNSFSLSRAWHPNSRRQEYHHPRMTTGIKKSRKEIIKKSSRSQKEWPWRYRIFASLCMFCLFAKVIYGSAPGFSLPFAANYVTRLRLISSKSLIVSPDTTRFGRSVQSSPAALVSTSV